MPLLETCRLSEQVRNLERQGHALLFLSALNGIMNVLALILWHVIS